MRRQLDSLSEELMEVSRTKDLMARENRRLQDDLAVMTKENQVMLGQVGPSGFMWVFGLMM